MRTTKGAFWWRWLGGTAATFGVVWGLMTVLDTGPRPGRLLLLVALATSVLALVILGVVTDGPDWSVHTGQATTPPGQDARLGMYTRVIAGHLDSRELDAALRDRFADLADRRLRQHHGLGLHAPGAVAILGDEATRILTGPPRRLSREAIARCVRRIEEV